MPRVIKFRYVLNYKGKVKIVFATLEEIEMGKMDEYLMQKSAEFRGKDKIIAKNQYSGFKDDNDKEIYTDDVIECLIGGEFYYKGKVYFEEGSFKVKHISLGIIDSLTNVGNIHENPSLLPLIV